MRDLRRPLWREFWRAVHLYSQIGSPFDPPQGGSTAPELEILVHDGAAEPALWVAGDFIL